MEDVQKIQSCATPARFDLPEQQTGIRPIVLSQYTSERYGRSGVFSRPFFHQGLVLSNSSALSLQDLSSDPLKSCVMPSRAVESTFGGLAGLPQTSEGD